MPVTALKRPLALVAKGAANRPEATKPAARQQLVALLRDFSLGVTAPSVAELAAVRSVLPARSQVFLAAVTGRPYADVIEAAVRVRAGGFEPVPHLAARDIESRDALDDVLSRLNRWAGVRRLVIVGGDAPCASGPFSSALDLIESGRLQRAGIVEIAVAGYPDGHPRLSQDALDRTLAAKIEAAEQTGLGVSIVTQFCFDATAVIRWVRRLRDLGIEHPVRIGFAGPANISALIHLARRCGVRASAQALTRHAGLTKHLLASGTPDRVLRPIADASCGGALGRLGAHFFAAGSAAATARWAAGAAAGRVVLEAGEGFSVEAPASAIAAVL
jgi:methylenetetrahydrofolate reductase (NADPH)